MSEGKNIFRRESGANMHATQNVWYSFYETGQTIPSGKYYCLTEEVKYGTMGPFIMISISSCEGDRCNSKEQPNFMVAITNQLDYLYLKHVGFRHIHDYKEYMEERMLPMMSESHFNQLLKDSNATIQDWMGVVTDIVDRHSSDKNKIKDDRADDEALQCFLKPLPVIQMNDDEEELLQKYITALKKANTDTKIHDARMYLMNYLKDQMRKFYKRTGLVYG